MSWIVMAMLAAAPTTIAIDGSTACAPRQVLERELRRAPVQFVEGAAALIVQECRRQFRLGVLDGKMAPDYRQAVSISTTSGAQ